MSSLSIRTVRPMFFATALALTSVAVAGCGGGEAKSASVAPGPMPEGETWSGVYYHQVYGYLHLQEEGSNVVGRWKRTDHSHWGELSGTATGNVLRFAWKEHKIGMVGPSATTKGKGIFVYKVNKENIGTLDGEYGLNDAETGSSWKPTVKQVRMPPDLKSVGGESEGVMPGQL